MTDFVLFIASIALAGSTMWLWLLLVDRDRCVAARLDLEARVRELETLAFVDEMTGVGNRRLFNRELAASVAHTLRAAESLALLAFDLNRLKQINDTRGHPVGDRVIRAFAEAVANSVRPTDVICRVGGDEFYVVLPSCSEGGLAVVVARIIANLRAVHVIDGDEFIPIAVSIGGTLLSVREGVAYVGSREIGVANRRSTGPVATETLISVADLALYDAKARKGREEYPYHVA